MKIRKNNEPHILVGFVCLTEVQSNCDDQIYVLARLGYTVPSYSIYMLLCSYCVDVLCSYCVDVVKVHNQLTLSMGNYAR